MRARATAKAILIGEHAAVHGVPAIAFPVPERVTEVEVELDAQGPLAVEDDRGLETATARAMARRAMELEGLGARGARLKVRSTIPPASGLGSSAALAVALVRALGDRRLSEAELAAKANDLEKLAHGTPSGVDAAAIAFGRTIRFRAGEPPEPVPLGAPVRIAVGVLPRFGTTASLVAKVRRLGDGEPARFARLMEGIREEVEAALIALRRGALQALGAGMRRAHDRLRELGVSTEACDRACAAALASGAIGAKLSGAGGGGAVLALLPPGSPERERAVLDALRAAGAGDCFVTELDR